jgi:uncharacterized membrane protein
MNGNRIPDPLPDNDDSKWIWGIFYFNPNDKRLFPPKRLGWGWTTNFANPYSILCFIAIIVGIGYIGKIL